MVREKVRYSVDTPIIHLWHQTIAVRRWAWIILAKCILATKKNQRYANTSGCDGVCGRMETKINALVTFQLQLWDTGGMERVASVTSSYYKFAEGAILVFALDNASSFHALSQHLLDIVSYAENAKIFLCGNKLDLVGRTPQVNVDRMELKLSIGPNLTNVLVFGDVGDWCRCRWLYRTVSKSN